MMKGIKDARILVVGGHPDDPDTLCGCSAAKWASEGAVVRFLSFHNGDKGHRTMTSAALAERRRGETAAAAKAFGIERYDVWDNPDCLSEPTVALRTKLANYIREFSPDVIITHRGCDYHVDHRVVATLVQDVTYLLGVPLFCPESKAMDVPPVVLFMADEFKRAGELRPDVLVDADPWMDRWCDAMACHVSQVFEWLPSDAYWGIRMPENVQADKAVRNAFLIESQAQIKINHAKLYADAWTAHRPNVPVPKYVETYEVSEYGRQPSAEELKAVFGF